MKRKSKAETAEETEKKGGYAEAGANMTPFVCENLTVPGTPIPLRLIVVYGCCVNVFGQSARSDGCCAIVGVMMCSLKTRECGATIGPWGNQIITRP
jgi:hypothetical protein